VCTNAASRARDGDPRFAPVALAGYTAADAPDRVYPYCARHVSRTYRLSVVCTPRYDACATKVIVRGAHAGPRTLGHPPSGCGIDPRFLVALPAVARPAAMPTLGVSVVRLQFVSQRPICRRTAKIVSAPTSRLR
jgi:hypothetical protein